MKEKDLEKIDALEIDPLSDADLEAASGGAEGCSVGCTQSYSCQCGTSSCCGGCLAGQEHLAK
jgi:hypothetical protein